MSNFLDEKGFVFIDDRSKPYWVTLYHNEPWIMYWNEGQKSWVTLRRLNASEVMLFDDKAIPDEQAKLYHEQHRKFINQIYSK